MKATVIMIVLFLLVGGALFAQVIPELGMVAYYKFDEGDGFTALDSSPNGLDGEMIDADYDEGVIGTGCYFDGVSAYVNCGNDELFNIDAEITLMAWVRPLDLFDTTHDPWVTKGDYTYAIKNGTGDYFEFFVYDATWNAPNVVLDSTYHDTWHHFAGTFDGGEQSMYIDGVMVFTQELPTFINVSEDEFWMGSNSSAPDRFFNGILDEVIVYDLALSEDEIADIYESYSNTAVATESRVTQFTLEQNYPNPFNPTTNITYTLPNTQFVTLKVYDVLGTEISALVNEQQAEGMHSVQFDGSNLAAGIYFYRLNVGNELVQTRKMMLMQ